MLEGFAVVPTPPFGHLLPAEGAGWRVKFATALKWVPSNPRLSRGGGARRAEVGTDVPIARVMWGQSKWNS